MLMFLHNSRFYDANFQNKFSINQTIKFSGVSYMSNILCECNATCNNVLFITKPKWL